MTAIISICIISNKSFKTTFNSNSNLASIFCRGPVNPLTPTFPIPILQKQLETYLLFQKSLKNGFNKLYFYHYTSDMSYESFSYLTLLSRYGPVNPSTPVLGNIDLTETMINLLVAWKFDQN